MANQRVIENFRTELIMVGLDMFMIRAKAKEKRRNVFDGFSL